jgi:cell division protein YceG involved in septum cleavage
MKMKNIIIVLVVIIIVLAGFVGYLLMQPAKNATLNTSNNTNNNISNNLSSNTNQNSVNQQSQSKSNYISSSKAQSIASDYISSNPKYKNYGAGTPSLQGSVYYVPIVVTNDNSQDSKGTVVGYVKIDANTGQVLGEATSTV